MKNILALLIFAAQLAAGIAGAASGVVSQSFVQSGTGAAARTFLDKAQDEFSVFDFMTPAERASVRAGNAAVNVSAAVIKATTAHAAALASSTAARPARALRFPQGVYKVSMMAATLGTYSNLSGITLIFDNATFTADTSETWTPGATQTLFRFSTVERVELRGRAHFIGRITTANFSTGTFDGAHAVLFSGKARGVKVGSLTAQGMGQVIQFDRVPALKVRAVATVGAGGTGYTNGATLTVSGGSPTTAATLTAVVSGGVVTGATVLNAGLYPAGVGPTIPPVAATDDGVSVTAGAGSGAKFNLFWEDADTSTRAENIVIDELSCETCWYGASFVYNGFGVVISRLRVNNVYRAFIAYGGVEDLQANITFRNHKGDALGIGSGAGLCLKNTRLNVTVLPPDGTLAATSASKIRMSYENSHPAVCSDNRINLNVDYGTAAGRGGSVFKLVPDDLKGRGRRNDLTITGRIDGTQDSDSGMGPTVVIGTDHNYAWSTSDNLGPWRIGPLTITNSTHAIGVFPRAFAYPITFDTVATAGPIYVNNGVGGTDYLTMRAQVETINSTFAQSGHDIRGAVRRVSSSTAGVLTATPTALFTIPGAGLYDVIAYVQAGGSTFVASGRVMSDGTSHRLTADNGAGLTLDLSGSSVRATQSTGSTQTVTWMYSRAL